MKLTTEQIVEICHSLDEQLSTTGLEIEFSTKNVDMDQIQYVNFARIKKWLPINDYVTIFNVKVLAFDDDQSPDEDHFSLFDGKEIKIYNIPLSKVDLVKAYLLFS